MSEIVGYERPVTSDDAALWKAATTIARTRAGSRLDHQRSAYHDLVHSIASLEEYLARTSVSRLDEPAVANLVLALCGVSEALGELHLYDRAVAWTDRMEAVVEQHRCMPATIAPATRRADALWELACSERVRGGRDAAQPWFEQARAAYVVAAAKASETPPNAHLTRELAAIACACEVMNGRWHPDTRNVLEDALELQRRAPRGYGRHLRLAASMLAYEEGREADAAATIARAADRVDWDGLGSTDLVILMEHAAMSAPTMLESESPTRTLVRRLVDDWHRRASADRDAYDEQLADERARVRARVPEPDIDPLTGVGNRRAVDAGFALLLSRARTGVGGFSVAYVDIDDFTIINGQHGHREGDAVLRRIAAALRSAFGREAVVARFGGDEFVVLVPDQTPAQVESTLAPLTRTRAAGTDFEITLTIGVARASSTSTVTDVLAAADLAMIDGKRAGKAQIVVVDG
ncbi:GGDEF domain-containing protein [Nocardioidaceae bacterium SCSIO 66511]|nr:GGDEF domain-containing protein [Nocardioidaceae bacterium SCSIO 66511]